MSPGLDPFRAATVRERDRSQGAALRAVSLVAEIFFKLVTG